MISLKMGEISFVNFNQTKFFRNQGNCFTFLNNLVIVFVYYPYIFLLFHNFLIVSLLTFQKLFRFLFVGKGLRYLREQKGKLFLGFKSSKNIPHFCVIDAYVFEETIYF